MGWLSGWDYRKRLTIKQLSGVVANSQIPVTVFKGSLPDGYKSITDFGFDCCIHDLNHPNAYYYNGKTYIAFMGFVSTDPYVMTYTHSTGVWSQPVKVATNPIPTDNHGAPSIIVDDSGYIHIFYGSHGTAQKYSRSTNPEDISAWTAKSDIGSLLTYPIVIKDSAGKLYLFVRTSAGGKYPENLYVSSDGGDSWADKGVIIDSEAASDDIYLTYALYDAANDIIHLAWHHRDASASVVWGRNVYYAYFKCSDEHLYDINDTDLGTQITFAEAESNCKAFNSSTNETHVARLALDESGNPFIIFVHQTAAGVYRCKVFYWNGSAWTTPVEVTGGTDSTFHLEGSIKVVSGSGATANLEVIRRTTTTAGIGTVTSSDGGATWGSVNMLLADSGLTPKKLTLVWYIENGQSDFNVIFADYTALRPMMRVYGYGDGGFLNNCGMAVSVESHCEDDFGDIRFTDDDGETELSYWRETYVSGNYALFWVKVADTIGSGDVTICLYYGNSGESTTSSGPNTWDFFDDFDSLDAWTARSGSWSVSSSELVSATTDGEQIVTSAFTTLNARLRAKYRLSHAGTASLAYCLMARTPDANNLYLISDQTAANEFNMYKRVATSWTKLTFIARTSDTNSHISEFRLNGTELSGLLDDITTFYILKGDASLSGNEEIGFRRGGTDSGKFFYVDWVVAGKYVDSRVSHGMWSAEEEQQLDVTTTYSTDVLFGIINQTEIFQLDVLFKELDVGLPYNIDVLMKKLNVSTSYLLDALLRAHNEKAYLIDLLLKKIDVTSTYDIDVMLEGVEAAEVITGLFERARIEQLLKIKQPILFGTISEPLVIVENPLKFPINETLFNLVYPIGRIKPIEQTLMITWAISNSLRQPILNVYQNIRIATVNNNIVSIKMPILIRTFQSQLTKVENTIYSKKMQSKRKKILDIDSI